MGIFTRAFDSCLQSKLIIILSIIAFLVSIFTIYAYTSIRNNPGPQGDQGPRGTVGPQGPSKIGPNN